MQTDYDAARGSLLRIMQKAIDSTLRSITVREQQLLSEDECENVKAVLEGRLERDYIALEKQLLLRRQIALLHDIKPASRSVSQRIDDFEVWCKDFDKRQQELREQIAKL